LVQTREAEAAARQDLEHQRLTIDELSRKLGDLEVRHRQDVDSQRKLVQERDEMQSTVRRTESAHSEEKERLRKELSSELERYKQLISDKEQVSIEKELKVMQADECWTARATFVCLTKSKSFGSGC
jgi:protein required for attachment to host cells